MTPQEMMGGVVKYAREELAAHESGRRPLPRRQVAEWQRIIDQWGRFEASADSADG